MESSLVDRLKREERELSARLAAVRQMLEAYGSGELDEITGNATAADGGPYARRTAGDALEILLLKNGVPVGYDQAIRGLLAGGGSLGKDPRLYYKVLRIVVGANPGRFVDRDGRIYLTAWKTSKETAEVNEG